MWYKQCLVIEFLVAKNVKPVDIHWLLLSVRLGHGTLDNSSVRRWVLWKSGCEVGKVILSDRDRCGRPVTVTDEVHRQKVDDFILENRRIKLKNTSSALGITYNNVFSTSYLNLGTDEFV